MKRALSYAVPAIILISIVLLATGAVKFPVQKQKKSTTGTAKNDMNEDVISGNLTGSDIGTAQTESSPATVISQTRDFPYTYVEVINDTNIIDAVVDVPDEVRENGYYETTATVLTFEDKVEDILACFEEYEPCLDSVDEQNVVYRGSDNFAAIFDADFSHLAINTNKYRYISMAYEDGVVLENYNRDLYMQDTSFDDFSLEDCDAEIRAVLDLLGFQGELQISHWALDHETMEEEAVELFMDGTESKPDYDWSENDDCYWCEFWQTCNGMRIIHSSSLITYGDILNQGVHSAVIGKERIIRMDILSLYDLLYSGDVAELLDFTEIVETYKEGSAQVAETSSIEITDIALLALPVSVGDGSYSFIPVWIFYGIRTDELEGQINWSPYGVFINAVSGEVLG